MKPSGNTIWSRCGSPVTEFLNVSPLACPSVRCQAIDVLDLPHVIHDGGGKGRVVRRPNPHHQEQIGCLASIYPGALGGDPWDVLGTTYEVAGLVKAPTSFYAAGVTATMTAGETELSEHANG
jgi:hypothetical protein